MAQKILYINPIKRSKHPLTKKGTKTMATKKKRKTKIRRRKPVVGAVVNVRSNPIKRRRRVTKRRNPIKIERRGSVRVVQGGMAQRFLMPAAVSAGGAVALDIAWSNLPIPVTLKTGALQHVAKAAIAIGMVKVAGNFMSRQNADRVGLGALTVLAHGVFRDMAKKAMPTLKMGEYGEIGEVDFLGEYVGSGGSLDFDAPLSFYATADEGANTIQTYPVLPAVAAPTVAPAAPAVGEYVMAGYDDGYDYDDGDY